METLLRGALILLLVWASVGAVENGDRIVGAILISAAMIINTLGYISDKLDKS